MDVDYDVYAEGEAELGWLNGQFEVKSTADFSLDELLMQLIGDLHRRLLSSSAEAAHLKVIGLCDGSYAVANLVMQFPRPGTFSSSSSLTNVANIVVNARVAPILNNSNSSCGKRDQPDLPTNRSAVFRVTMQSFRPAAPSQLTASEEQSLFAPRTNTDFTPHTKHGSRFRRAKSNLGTTIRAGVNHSA